MFVVHENILHQHTLTRNIIRDIIYFVEVIVKSYSSREVIKLLEDDGWYEVDVNGSHHQYKHHLKKGRVTVPHPRKDLSLRTLKSIQKQSGLIFE